MMKILGRNNSVNVIKVLWCATELGLEFERTDVGGAFGGNDQPEYLEKNPMGRVPTVEVDGHILWESQAIVRYLAAKHQSRVGRLELVGRGTGYSNQRRPRR